jgi:hypothetical protein
MRESKSEVLKIEESGLESESDLLCTDSKALLTVYDITVISLLQRVSA